MRYYTPLRYPGGKGRLAGFMKDLIQHNDLSEGTYIEPYAGGAAVALTLLIEEYAWRVVINDFDPLIYAFWHSVLYETDDLLKMLHDTPVKMKQWHEQRAIHKNPENHSTIEVGFATLFMNRTNRSGIIKAGVIGGKTKMAHILLTPATTKRIWQNESNVLHNTKTGLRYSIVTQWMSSPMKPCLEMDHLSST